MRESREDVVRSVSRGYAVLLGFAAAASLGLTALMFAFMPLQNIISNSKSAMVSLPALGALLVPFIWRQQVWAMLAALVLAVGLRFWFGNDTEFLKWMLTGFAVVFAVLTGVRLWLGNARN
jgi:hypothetical protein